MVGEGSAVLVGCKIEWRSAQVEDSRHLHRQALNKTFFSVRARSVVMVGGGSC